MHKMRSMKSLFAVALLLASSGALAQTSPGLVFGQVPTAGQWNSYFSSKQDFLGNPLPTTAGGTGINNGGNTITVGGPFVTTGGFGLTLTLTGATSLTLPTSGTLLASPLAPGSVGLTALATQATNTVVGNATSGAASPTALAVGTCSTSASALIWTTNTGFGCNTAINATQLGGATFAAPTSIGSGTPSTGAFTTLTSTGTVSLSPANLGVTLSPTGTGTVTINPSTASTINNSSIGVTTPLAGKFTTLQSTSTYTPSTTFGIVGTTAADNAQAGSIGEVVSSVLSVGSAVSLVSNTVSNITSVSLTAGDWDCTGVVSFAFTATTSYQILSGAITTVSNTLPNVNSGGFSTFTAPPTAPGGNTTALPIATVRMNVSGTTTVFLESMGFFSASTLTTWGGIYCRRQR